MLKNNRSLQSKIFYWSPPLSLYTNPLTMKLMMSIEHVYSDILESQWSNFALIDPFTTYVIIKMGSHLGNGSNFELRAGYHSLTVQLFCCRVKKKKFNVDSRSTEFWQNYNLYKTTTVLELRVAMEPVDTVDLIQVSVLFFESRFCAQKVKYWHLTPSLCQLVPF